MSRPDFKEFSMLAMLYDQTEIVHFIIQHENKIDKGEFFYNNYDLNISLSTGKKIMPSQHYHDQLDRLGSEYRSLLSRKQELADENEDTSEIETEMESVFSLIIEYEEAEYTDRKIYEWRLIPFWLAEILIKKGETVFRHFGSSWWGIKDIMYTGIINHKILAELYNEL